MRMKPLGGHEKNICVWCLFFYDSASIPWNKQNDIIKLFQLEGFSPDLWHRLGNTTAFSG